MLTRWYDINREIAALDELHRRMNRLFGAESNRESRRVGLSGSWPPANLFDTGSSLTATMQVPGLKDTELKVEVHGDVLTISGERSAEAPEGYRAHRRERGTRAFSRSFGLPCEVDAEKTVAGLKDGILTITMEKHVSAQPRQITVSAS